MNLKPSTENEKSNSLNKLLKKYDMKNSLNDKSDKINNVKMNSSKERVRS